MNKIHLVLQVLNDENVDIACIQETWLSSESSTTTSIIKQAGYNINHVFRNNKRGAGVAILWKEKYKHISRTCKIPVQTYSSFQYQCTVFNFKTKLLIISIYRLQEISFNQFLTDLESLINDHFSFSQSLILIGDLNVHFEKNESHDTILLSDLASSFGLSQLVNSPTHKHGHTLDLIFLNNFELQASTSIPTDYDIGDHFPVFLTVNNLEGPAQNNIKQTVCYRNIRGIDLVEFSATLCNQFESLSDSQDFLSGYQNFSDVSQETLNHYAPLQTKTISVKNNIPWQDSEYRNERALRRKLERKWKKCGKKVGPERTAYIEQRSKCAKLATLKRSQFYRNLIHKNEGDQSSLFKVVSQVLDKQKAPVLPQFDNQPEKLANRFNHFYIDKVQKIRAEIPAIDSSETCSSQPIFSGTPLDILLPTNVEELREIMKGSVIKTAYEDVLPRPVMKEVFDKILPYICDLINLSLKTGCVDGVKQSTIVPLLKKCGLDPEILKNYRPVADIVLISKLIEKVVLKRLNNHAYLNNLQCDSQHGYKKHHSTETLLLKVVNDILVGFDSNKGTILLLLDLSAAFDTVDHNKLLSILEMEFGITGTALKWFKSFLIGRTQRVRINDSFSDCLNVIFGVPQGSVLGPVLFNIYSRSLYDIISRAGFSTSGYADDSNARNSFSLIFQHSIITKHLPELMNQITQWMNSFFLKINPDKTEIILFVPYALRNHPTINGAFFGNGTCIRFSDLVTNLGVKLDKFLTFESHVNSTVAFCYKLLKDVSSIRDLISTNETEMLVHSIISSRLDYCNSLFYNLNKSIIDKFQKVQNAAARLVLKIKKYKPIRQELVNLHWLRINERILFKLLVLTFKCLNNMAPVELSYLLNVRCDNSHMLQYVFMDSIYGRRSFMYIAPRLWNALPIHIRRLHSLDNFKSKIKYHLFNHSREFLQSVNMYQ